MMRSKQTSLKDIDEYIAGFPDDVQEILEKIRMTIRKAAPDAEETISYQIPTFTLNKPIPFGLIKRIVKFRVKENLERARGKKK